MQPPPLPKTPIDRETRLMILENEIARFAAYGYQVVSKNQEMFFCTFVKPKEKTNHVLHLLLSVFTCFIWLLIWFFVSHSSNKGESFTISVDEYGNVYGRPIAM